MGIYHQVMPYAWPFFVGGMVLSMVGGLLAYPLAYAFHFTNIVRASQPRT